MRIIVRKKEKISFAVMTLGLGLVLMLFNNDSSLGVYQFVIFYVVAVVTCLITYIVNCSSNEKMIAKAIVRQRIPSFKIENMSMIILVGISAIGIYRFPELYSNGTFFSYMVLFAVYFFITSVVYNKRTIKFLLNSFIIGAVIISLCVIIQQVPYTGLKDRLTMQVFGNMPIDPNYLSFFVMLPNTLLLSRIFFVKKYTIFNLIGFVLTTVAIVMSGSRMGIGVMLMGAFFVMVELFSRTKSKNKPLFLVIALGVLILAVIIFFAVAPENIINRILSLNDDSNKLRLRHWQEAWTVAKTNLLFGFGATDSSIILGKFKFYGSAHNTFLAFLLSFGLVGFAIFCVIVFKTIYKLLKNKMYIYVGIMISLGFCSIILVTSITVTLWTIMILFFMVNEWKASNPGEDYVKNII